MCVTSTSIGAGTDSPEAHLPREERRRRTEAAILEAARALFAESGFEKTTIRAVAAKAGIDPALVMQYYGNKEGLFAASARWQVDHKRIGSAALGDIPHIAIEDLFATFEDPSHRDETIALLRNCLTHDSALEIVRDEVMCETQEMIARTIGGDDAELRAGLLGSTMMGLILGRYLLELPAVKAASREDLERVLLPILEALVNPPATS
ncbi:MAG: transcriptional regulator, TetR family [Frankiales bacterium]|jgi:AcrR family transcriptional regulator|nr:transcriptional regulator, TetR family [Frankiales bacterium]